MQFKNIFNSTYRFSLQNTQSPTLYQLAHYMQAAGFKPSKLAWRAHISDLNLNFSPALCECLEFKHLLAQLVQHYCPTVMPETYLFDEYSWSTSLSDLANAHYTTETLHLNDKVENLAWILKPALLNNGQHIKLFDRLSQIESYLLSSNRLGGPHVLQRYIHDPDLFDGRKYSLRFFVVITQEAGAFLYQHGYMNLAKSYYNPNDFTDLSSHLTNEHLMSHLLSAKAADTSIPQIPTTHIAGYSTWYPQIQYIVKAVTNGLESAFPNAFVVQKERSFAVFGFDFMLDSKQRAWLLEVNHGPCFPIDEHHPLQQTLYHAFWTSMIEQFILPIASNKPINLTECAGFESIHSICP